MPDITAPIVDWATGLVGSHGVWMVFVLMALESACIPIPSEAIMLLGGVLVARGDANLVAIIAAGVLGNLVGSLLAYGLGRWKGREWLLALPILHVTPKRLDQADRWFARFGDRAVLISRCLPVIRTFISLPAGIARMPLGRFTAFTLVGCIPWVAGLTLIGRAVGKNWRDVQHNLHYFDLAIVLAIVIGAIWLLLRNRNRTKRGEHA